MMVDKLDIRFDMLTPLKHEFHEVLEEVRNHPKDYGFVQSEHYAVFGSLVPFGIEANFHGWLRHKIPERPQGHKLEMLNVGDYGKSAVMADLERVVDIDPRRLELIRIDLAADVPDVPVSFFHRHMRVARKRRGARVTEFEHIYQGEGETIYFGKRPNCFRVYNKTAELMKQHKRMLRNDKKSFQRYLRTLRTNEQPQTFEEYQRRCVSIDNEVPTFEQSYKCKVTDIKTRVERQIGGGRLPSCVARVGDLDRLPDYNPYGAVLMFAGESSLPSRQDYTFTQYEAGMHLRIMQQAFGIDYVRNHIRNCVGKNASATFELYEPFFRCVAGNDGVTPEQLYDFYRDSVTRQMAA